MAGPLEHASQRVDKVTHVTLPAVQSSTPGDAIPKANYVASMALQPGDVDGVVTGGSQPSAANTEPASSASTALADVLRKYEGSPLPSTLPEPSVFANVAGADLLAFGKALQTRRSDMLARLAGDANSDAAASLTGLLNSVTVANTNFTASGAVNPIGMLYLERLEMTPAGITRGDLLGTIPLAPGETTSVYQKEWSVTSSEFTSIVTDSLENYSETGVTENTNLAQSTTSQNTHNNQYNVTASASGGCGFVSGSVSTSLGATDAASQSATQSRNDAVKTTRQASSRVKQEHKMSISTTTVTGTQQSSTRTLTNPTANAIRIDYFSMMEEWRVRLYRYGLRLTYDLTIPEPGSTLREQYAQIDDLTATANQQFVFPYNINDITEDNYVTLASRYGVAVPPPPGPQPGKPVPPDETVPPVVWSDTPNKGLFPVTLAIPQNYWIKHLMMQGVLNEGTTPSNTPGGVGGLYVTALGSGYIVTGSSWNEPAGIDLAAPPFGFLLHATGTQTFNVLFDNVDVVNSSPYLAFVASLELMPTAWQTWQTNAWQTLYNGAQTQFYASVQAATGKLKALQDQLNNVDTLTLRREENDEIMKGILRFLLGAWFDFMPQSVINALEKNITIAAGGSNYKVDDQISVTGGGGKDALLVVTQLGPGGSVAAFTIQNYGWGYSTTRSAATSGGHGTGLTVNITVETKDVIEHGEAFSNALLRLPASALTTLGNYGQTILFINEAIEWENLIFYLDSYFWDIPASWDFIRQIQHPDADRQAFLRAGSARVVVPVRKGYELAWVQFIQGGSLTATLPADSPYMTIAQQIQDQDNTNYPGIPPANPADAGSSVIASTSSTDTLSPSISPVQINVQSSAGFIVGYVAVIDSGQNAESELIIAVPDGATITVQRLVSAHDGSTTPLPIVMDYEAGVLVAEWNEYTPTSGTDIAVTSNLATIA